ncbi:hydrolase [Paenibacillus silagei]|uniref:Nicotinamidase-related amidase n=1 Tax=Paenibacillus silagei TaxID=1670801 RepID=A0ABS4NMV5_9BACL|nr:hydrolase [Paenibacillus silagei]MBP2110697.1 nicotinamidase-related amidase [Paenibacillus silagei]
MEELDETAALTLDAATSALVVIDLQNGIAASGRQAAPYTADQVIGNAVKLVDAFTQKGAFVVLVRVSSLDGRDMVRPVTDSVAAPVNYPEGWDQIVPAIAGFKNTYTVTKRQWGAFFGTDLDLQLRRRGIQSIVLCGISTSIGVDTTAREAYQLGYQQVFAEDAMTASTREEHDYVCRTIFPRIGRIRTSEEIAAGLK